MEKFLRKWFLCILAVILPLYLPAVPAGAEESAGEARPVEVLNEGEARPVDVFIVLDNSYGMKVADPDKAAVDCCDAFYEYSPAGRSAVGFLTFSGEVEQKGKLLKDIGTEIKEPWTGSYTQTGDNENIDIVSALNAAADALITEGTNPNKAIILITDNYNTSGEAYEPVEYDGKPIPVYCIYMEPQDDSYPLVVRTREDAKAYLQKVAEDTGTEDYYAEPASAGELDVCLHSIANEIYNTESERMDLLIKELDPFDQTFEVPAGTAELNCNVPHDPSELFTLLIKDPYGNIIYDNGEHSSPLVTFVDTPSNACVKIRLPVTGAYTFTMSSDKEQEITLTTVTVPATLDLQLDNDTVGLGTSVEVTLKAPEGSGASILQSEVHLVDAMGNTVFAGDEFGITPNGKDSYSINTELMEQGTYGVVATADTDDGLSRESARVQLVIGEKQKSTRTPIVGGLVGAVVVVLVVLFVLYGVSPRNYRHR